MFAENSRYRRVPEVDAPTADGRSVRAVTLRRLPLPTGDAVMVSGNDRLDVMAQRRYGDATMFWHIADANSELEANTLVAEAGRTITVPAK
jgi:hypothetical protein